MNKNIKVLIVVVILVGLVILVIWGLANLVLVTPISFERECSELCTKYGYLYINYDSKSDVCNCYENYPNQEFWSVSDFSRLLGEKWK